ncbi:MAG: hypothetical protein A3E78_01905 [Alphaproteobacteria bacterium RIFCSPHIGHO2_12_FULL_63_12]|nr:MAG: hypothetical protein A3E78_01905 [Alphaproteobacteria bacterium RIFCSPHIGHO2_12_FULL_63_12]
MKKPTRGGRREGAGRKPKFDDGPAVQVSAQVPEGCKGWLEQQASDADVSVSEVAARVLVRAWRRSTK